jgi:putative holliday junction resolvase
MRILAVDPGEKRIGLAISDPTGTLARPLAVLKHIKRQVDAATIVQTAEENQVALIIVGHALNDEGESTSQSRLAERLAEAIREQTSLPVKMWDESGSTQAARETRLASGAPRRKRSGHLDDVAAAIILQNYLDSKL